MRLDFFVKLKCQSSTIILSVGNKYSVRDLYFMTSLTMPDPHA